MTRFQLLSVAIAFAAGTAAVSAGPPPRVSIGFQFGGPPVPYYRPYYAPYYRPYYYPPPVIIEPAPIVYAPRPVVVQQPVYVQQPTVVQQPAVVQEPPAVSQPTYAQQPQPTVIEASRTNPATDAHLANLRNSNETVRRDSVMELGRMKAYSAVQPLTATLAGDQSPLVREAAARALGLIGSPSALTALTHAAQADPDRDVRHSAQFAVDVIKTNNR